MNDHIYIININGAPGIGKSALAIHIGHQLVRRCIQVRYIDTTEYYLFRGRESNESATTKIRNNVCQTNLELRGKTEVSLYSNVDSNIQSKLRMEMDGLLKWARSVERPTLLILDNCDEILNSSLRDDFIELIRRISQMPHRNVKIIATSQEKLIFHNNFISTNIRELHEKTSTELLTELAPDLPSHNAVELVDAVGGHPLALTVIGNMIHNSGLDLLPTLLGQLKTEPLIPLDKVSDRKSKFRAIMDTACSYIDRETQECAHLLSYFPGSFDKRVKHKVISLLKKSQCDVDLVTHSLLEEYFLHYDHRFKMHKLIKEYFRERDGGEHKHLFDSTFALYVSELILNYTALYVSQVINEEEEHKLLTESHNIMYLSELLQDNHTLYHTHARSDFLLGFSGLVMQFSKPLVLYSKDVIKQIFLWTISEDTFDFVHQIFQFNNSCASYYSVILDKAHEVLCDHGDGQEGHFNESCELLQCNVTKLTALVCQEVHADVCKQIESLNQWCSGISSITWKSMAITLIVYLIVGVAVYMFNELVLSHLEIDTCTVKFLSNIFWGVYILTIAYAIVF